MTIAIVGLGLIGGSFAFALRNNRMVTSIIGVENKVVHKQQALAVGMVDRTTVLSRALKEADLIIFATPVDYTLKEIRFVLDNMKRSAIVMDTGSTKELICAEARSHRRRCRFVATHPMAGTEYSGPTAAQDDLFKNKNVIICEPHYSDKESLQTVESLYKSMGAELVYYKLAGTHDKDMAYASHISHVSSFMLGLAVVQLGYHNERLAKLAGTGFASTVRLAKSSPDTWAPILLQNAPNVLCALDNYIKNLQEMRENIAQGKFQRLHRLLYLANKITKFIK